VQGTAGPLANLGGGLLTDPSGRLSAEAASRILLAAAGVGAALVLAASWTTVTPVLALALALAIVVGAVHGVVGWAPKVGVPGRLGVPSFVVYGLVLALWLFLLTADRLGGDEASVLWTRLASGVVISTAVHWVLDRQADRPAALPDWRELAVLALLPGALGAGLLAVYGPPTPPGAAAGGASGAAVLAGRR